LEKLLAKQAGVSVTDGLATDRGQQEAKTHASVDFNRFHALAASANMSNSTVRIPSANDQYWCVHCPHLWAQFLTAVEVFDTPLGRRATLRRTRLALYRQSLLEPVPFTVWASISAPARPLQPAMHLLIDLDCPINPLDTDRRGYFGHSERVEPISLFLGTIPLLNGGMCWVPVGENQRLPDALDQMLFLADLGNQLSRVKDQLGLDLNRIANLFRNPTGSEELTVSLLLYTVAFVVQNPIQLHLVPPDAQEDPVLHQSDEALRTSQQSSEISHPQGMEHSGHDSSRSRSSLMNEQDGPSALLDASVYSKYKKDTSFPLLAKNRQPDNLSIKSSSTSDITAVSGDFVDNVSVAGSQENWLNTYEVLFRLEDELKDSDSASVSGSSGCTSGHKPTHLMPTVVQEVGTELFETESLRSSQLSGASDPEAPGSGLGRSSRLSTRSFGDRNQREATCRPRSPDESSTPLVIVFQLDGVAGEADGTDIETRMWLKVGRIGLTCQQGNQNRIADAKLLSESLASLTSTGGYSWSVFASLTRQLIGQSSDDSENEVSYQTSVCLHADLLTSYSLQVPKIVPQTAGQLLNCFSARGGIDRLQSMLPTGTLLREMQARLTTMDFNLHLKRGFLAVEIESSNSNYSQSGELIRKVHLQQGFSLAFDRNAVLNIGLTDVENRNSIYSERPDPDKKVETNTVDHTFVRPNAQSGQNNMLRQYQQENAQLRENVRRLNATIDQLNAELASLRHMVNHAQQR
uniref:DUF3668 domain-containing protein n=1 Tax=Echinostoma caproni TaxID=27848 RepID=A0A183AI41_9TREM